MIFPISFPANDEPLFTLYPRLASLVGTNVQAPITFSKIPQDKDDATFGSSS